MTSLVIRAKTNKGNCLIFKQTVFAFTYSSIDGSMTNMACSRHHLPYVKVDAKSRIGNAFLVESNEMDLLRSFSSSVYVYTLQGAASGLVSTHGRVLSIALKQSTR